MGRIKIITPGMLTTVQDGGRYGYEAYGMPVSGVMDWFSFKAANILIDNDENAPVLEITAQGPVIEFEEKTFIAVTGGDLGAKINQVPVAPWHSVSVYKGDRLSFSALRSGLRCYVAFAGGIKADQVMGSQSTYLKGSIGGYQGRRLEKGDILLTGHGRFQRFKKLHKDLIPVYQNGHILRVIPGPQEDYFKQESIEHFYCKPYKVTAESDRMGYRLSGRKLDFMDSSDIISDGIVMGSVQVPGSGQPIILMSDRQTAGGYPKIAAVIKADLPMVAQAKPGAELTFKKVTLEEAHRILREKEKILDTIRTFYKKSTALSGTK